MRRLIILQVEDSYEEAVLLARACQAAGLPAEFHEASSGADAISYLLGEGAFADRTQHPLPDLIVLDLRMPGMNGIEFLQWARRHPRFKEIPVLVFTVSREPGDREIALEHGASGFYVKPFGFEALVRLAESFAQFVSGPRAN
ncbi:MAG TPA: response regulator [Verrucomicrobiae bacterium]|nr:response regulator [Verrucomicrobiae bacterium]